MFAPISTEQTHLVDGGIVNNLPVDVALDAGADLVIAVDCATPLRTQKHEIEDIIDVIDQAVSFRIEEKKVANRKRAHVLIVPDLKKFDGGDFNLSYTLIPVGEKEAEKHLNAIWKALQKLGISKRVEKRPSILPDDFDFRTWVDIPSDIVIDRVRIEGLERYSQEVFTSPIGKVCQQADIVPETNESAILCDRLFQNVDTRSIYMKLYRIGFRLLENPQ